MPDISVIPAVVLGVTTVVTSTSIALAAMHRERHKTRRAEGEYALRREVGLWHGDPAVLLGLDAVRRAERDVPRAMSRRSGAPGRVESP